MRAPAGGRLVLVFTEFTRLPSNPGGSPCGHYLILAEAMEAQGQRGQGICPRSQSRQNQNPRVFFSPYSFNLSCLGPSMSP